MYAPGMENSAKKALKYSGVLISLPFMPLVSLSYRAQSESGVNDGKEEGMLLRRAISADCTKEFVRSYDI